VDTGTGQGFALRRSNPDKRSAADGAEAGIQNLSEPSANLQGTSAANAATAMLGQIAAEGHPLAPGPSGPAVGTPHTSSGPVVLSVVPAAK